MLTGLIAWFQSLDATFAFLLLLPVVVAIAGLLADFLRPGGRSDTNGR